MTDETTPWYSRTLTALKAAASWVVLDAAPAVRSWAKANRRPLGRFVVTLVLVLVITQLIIWTHQLTTRRVAEKVSAAPAQRAAVAADPLRQLDERVVALEVSVAGLLAAELAQVPPSSAARNSSASVPAGSASATPGQPFGHTDLDRRLAEFQRRIDATPSPTTTLKETAK